MDPWWKWRARSHPVRVCREALVVRKAHEEQLEVMGKELAAWRVHAGGSDAVRMTRAVKAWAVENPTGPVPQKQVLSLAWPEKGTAINSASSSLI